MRPAELLLRFTLAAGISMVSGLAAGEYFCKLLRPLFRLFMESCVPGVVIRGLDVIHEGGGELLVAVVVPVRTAAMSAVLPGPMLVSVTVGGVLVTAQASLAVALAWPVQQWREALIRGLLMAGLMPLLMLSGPLTLSAECLATVWEYAGLSGVPPLMVVSRLLMGGGSLAVGLAAGAVAVVLGRCVRERAGTWRGTESAA